MAQFRLRIAADDLVFLGFLQKDLMLFGRSLFAEGDLAVSGQSDLHYHFSSKRHTKNMLAWSP